MFSMSGMPAVGLSCGHAVGWVARIGHACHAVASLNDITASCSRTVGPTNSFSGKSTCSNTAQWSEVQKNLSAPFLFIQTIIQKPLSVLRWGHEKDDFCDIFIILSNLILWLRVRVVFWTGFRSGVPGPRPSSSPDCCVSAEWTTWPATWPTPKGEIFPDSSSNKPAGPRKR